MQSDPAMTRSTLLCVPLSLLLLPSCLLDRDGDDDGDDPPEPGDGPLVCTPDGCPDGEAAFVFDTDLERLAGGTELDVYYFASPYLPGYRVVSSDPDVLEVEYDDLSMHLVGRAPGSATLVAEATDPSWVLAELPVTVVEVASVDFRFRTTPVAPEPIDRLAGLVGTTDSLRVDYRSADGEALRGSARFSARGAVAIADPDLVESRVSEGFEPGDIARLEFAELGEGELSADLVDGRSFPLPIEVVAEPASIEVITMVVRDGLVAAAQVDVGEPIGANVIGRTGDGRFVAGVSASWATSGPIEFWFDDGPATEVVFSIESPVAAGITATHSSFTASRALVAR